MTWTFEVSEEFARDYRKHCRKNEGFRRAVDSKIAEILQDPTRYKPLRAPLQGMRRVHIAGSYVMVFEPHVARGSVRFLRLAHHDEAYGV